LLIERISSKFPLRIVFRKSVIVLGILLISLELILQFASFYVWRTRRPDHSTRTLCVGDVSLVGAHSVDDPFQLRSLLKGSPLTVEDETSTKLSSAQAVNIIDRYLDAEPIAVVYLMIGTQDLRLPTERL